MSQPQDSTPSSPAPRGARFFSALAAWALAFGCAIGWDSFVMPWTEFLPMAGPLGTAIGLLLGALVMSIVAWNFHVMANRLPGPGSVYSYASATFGNDHGFLCGWFLSFTYMAIVWLDANVLGVAASMAFGDLLRVGPHYVIDGFEIYLPCVGVSVVAIAAAAAICCRRRVARLTQIFFALAFFAGAIACFLSALRQGGGLAGVKPLFAAGPDALGPLSQILRIVALAPWLFIGFETVTVISDGRHFPVRRSFWIMMSALAAAVISYAFLTAIPALAPPPGATNWVTAIAQSGPSPEAAAFSTAGRTFGAIGKPIVLSILFAAIFTNLVGNTIAASRLLSAMAADGSLPRWLGVTTTTGVPRNAVIGIVVLSGFIIALGSTAITVMVDLALVGAAFAYAYTSAAAYKTARDTGSRLTCVTGLVGIVLSIVILLLYILPAFTSHTALMSTQSYLVIALWCIAGLVSFLYVFRHDRTRRFGQTLYVWIGLLAVVFLMGLLWIRESALETTQKAFDDIITNHAKLHPEDFAAGDYSAVLHQDWHELLRGELDAVNHTILRHNVAQTALAVLAFALMIRLYSILRRREREHELEKARAKSFFFSTVSHDIRTPLNAIIGFSEMLKLGFRTEAERRQAVDAILVSSKTLLGLVNDVLDLSKLESGKMEITPEPTDVPTLLRGVLDAFRAAATDRAFDLRMHIGAMPPLLLDPQRIRQIAFNLLGNAVKFTQKGFVELRAAYVPDAGGKTGRFILEVEDTGYGMTPEDLARIGAAYVQLGSAQRNRNGGTGLGLAICRNLAAAMGGTLSAVSEPGEGSTFTLALSSVPVAQDAPATQPAVLPDPQPELPPQPSPKPQKSQKNKHRKPKPAIPRILLVDDSKLNLMVLKALIKRLGTYDIVFAENGQEALDILTKPSAAPFDLVLTDMWMPNLDGEGLVRAIRANPKLASLRVVIITADVELQAKAADLGFDGILLKPITPDLLRPLLPSV